MLNVSAQQQSNPKNPCTAANPCSQQICGDHICAPGEYLKLQHELAQAQITSSMQNTTGMKNTGMQNPPSIPSIGDRNTTGVQNMTGMQNTGMQNPPGIQNTTNMQNTTSGISENNQAVPEFGSIASLVLVIAIVSVMTVTMKARVSLKL